MKVVYPPTEFEANTPGSVPSVFLAGSIDMGSAEDWQSKIIEELKDVDCVVLNPRRKDWDCVDSETMALTPNGPKPYSELHVGDPIFTFSQDRDVLEVQPIEKINIFDIDGELIEFTRNDCSFFFTENHDLLDRTSNRHNRTKKVKAAWFLGKKEAVRFPAGKSLEDADEDEIIPYGRGFSDDHFRFAAWVLSEGTIFVRKDTGATQVSIAQYKKNRNKVEGIADLLGRLEMNYRYDNRQFVLDKESSDFVVGIMGLEKYKLPTWVIDAPIRQRKIFIYEYAKGDGCMVGDRISYLCFGDRHRSFAQEIMVLCYGSGIGIKWKDKTSGFGHPVINLVPHSEDKKWFCLKAKGKVPYRGIVWCPTTKNGTWVAYRNGLPFITGNSSWKQDISNDKFREQVEWELKGLEQARLIALCLTPESKAPISLLELGLHAFDGKMVVCCPEGFWRKGNVDIVCRRYGIPLFSSFEDFKNETARRMRASGGIAPATRSATASAVSKGECARQFVAGMLRLAVHGVSVSVSPTRLQDGFFSDLVSSAGFDGKNWWWIDTETGLRNSYSDKSKFTYALAQELASQQMALRIIRRIEEMMTSKTASTHSFGSPLRSRPDYGEGGINERLDAIASRVAAYSSSYWDNEIEGGFFRLRWRDSNSREYLLEEMPTKGKKKLRVVSGGFAPWIHNQQFASSILMVNAVRGISSGMSFDQVLSTLTKNMERLFEDSGHDAPVKDIIYGPNERETHFLNVDPPNSRPFVADGKDFNVEVSWTTFKSYSPGSDFQQADPSYTMYVSTAPASARKMYLILSNDPNALKSVSWDAFGQWMKKNGINYETRFSQWH